MSRLGALPLLLVVGALSSCGGSGRDEAPQAPVELSLNGNLGALRQGDSLVLTWRAQNAQACTAGGAWSGSKPVLGTQSIIVNSFGTSTYSLTCTTGSSSATSSVTVSVEQTVATSSVQPTVETVISLPSIATVTVLPGTFSSVTQAEIRQTQSSNSVVLFQEVASLFSAANPNTYQVKIKFGNARPMTVVRARVNLPLNFGVNLAN